MAKMRLTLEKLKDLDYGKIHVVFERHMRRGVQDCLDRPADNKPREILLRFLLVPDTDQNGDCCHIKVEATVTLKVPPHRSRVYECIPRKNGELFFNPQEPDDVEQTSLYDPAEPQGDDHGPGQRDQGNPRDGGQGEP